MIDAAKNEMELIGGQEHHNYNALKYALKI